MSTPTFTHAQRAVIDASRFHPRDLPCGSVLAEKGITVDESWPGRVTHSLAHELAQKWQEYGVESLASPEQEQGLGSYVDFVAQIVGKENATFDNEGEVATFTVNGNTYQGSGMVLIASQLVSSTARPFGVDYLTVNATLAGIFSTTESGVIAWLNALSNQIQVIENENIYTPHGLEDVSARAATLADRLISEAGNQGVGIPSLIGASISLAIAKDWVSYDEVLEQLSSGIDPRQLNKGLGHSAVRDRTITLEDMKDFQEFDDLLDF